ncbi:MAG TPA: hypothetical protein VIJ37_07180, partial [Steroidobacteraceae bacterium]
MTTEVIQSAAGDGRRTLSARALTVRAFARSLCGIIVIPLALMSCPVPGFTAPAPAPDALPAGVLLAGPVGSSPVPNAAFYPGSNALAAPGFAGVLRLQQSPLRTR